MATPGDEELVTTLHKVDEVRQRTRAAVHPVWFPMLVFGLLGLASLPLSRIGEGKATGLFWLVAGPAGGFATARYYGTRAVSLGVGMRGRAHTALGIVIFLSAWITGFLSHTAAGPMLAVSLGYLLFARLERSWPVAGVAAALGLAAVVIAITDPTDGDIILTLLFGLAFTVTGLILRRRDPAA